MDRVTKTKHPGRVASGKRLAGWNRKNKENLVKNKEQVESSNLSSDQQVESSNLSSDQQEPQSQTSTVVYGGALAIVAVIGVALYMYHGKKPAPPSSAPSNNDDIFCMN